MKAHIYVNLKHTVLDPQGQAILGALRKMRYKGVQEVRQGKHFELTLDDSMNQEQTRAEAERIARDVLANPVMEEFTVRLEE